MAGLMVATEASLSNLSGTVLINGPAYSGKSSLVNRIASQNVSTLVIGAGDLAEPGIAVRVQELRAQRPAHWEHGPAQLDLAAQITVALTQFEQIIVEAINPWLARALFAGYTTHHQIDQAGATVYQYLQNLCQVLATHTEARIYLVSADVTSSLAPEAELPRLQRELSGRAVQHLGLNCRHVIQMLAGLPLLLTKG